MKRNIVFFLAVLCAASLLIGFPQSAEAQGNDVKVLSYSWYVSPATGNFIVVGDVQNTGSSIIGSATITGNVYTQDGQPQAYNDLSQIYAATQILPNQTAPFYMEFTPYTSTYGNLTWISLGIERVDFNIHETATNTTGYSGLKIMQDTSYVDQSGNYTVIGVVQNNGTGYPENVWAVATFYNATGTVVATGYSDYVSPHFLPPNASASFMFIPNDPTPEMASEIASYSLQILTSGSTTQPAPSPSISASVEPSSSPSESTSPSQSATSSASASPTNPQSEASIPLSYVYAIIAAFVIAIIIIALAFMLRKKPATKTQ